MSKKNYRDITITIRKYNFNGYSEVLGKHSVEDLSEVSTTCAAQACRQKKTAQQKTVTAKKKAVHKAQRKANIKHKIINSLFKTDEDEKFFEGVNT